MREVNFLIDWFKEALILMIDYLIIDEIELTGRDDLWIYLKLFVEE